MSHCIPAERKAPRKRLRSFPGVMVTRGGQRTVTVLGFIAPGEPVRARFPEGRFHRRVRDTVSLGRYAVCDSAGNWYCPCENLVRFRLPKSNRARSDVALYRDDPACPYCPRSYAKLKKRGFDPDLMLKLRYGKGWAFKSIGLYTGVTENCLTGFFVFRARQNGRELIPDNATGFEHLTPASRAEIAEILR